MKAIHYAGDELQTGDALADAVVRYAQALAATSRSAAIDIPIRLGDGSVRNVSFLLGPASQLVAIPVDSSLGEVVDDALVGRLDEEVALLGVPRAGPLEPEDIQDAGEIDY